MAKRRKLHRKLYLIDLEESPRPAPERLPRGSIEQHLDMIESGPLRGDEILHQHGIPEPSAGSAPLSEKFMSENYHFDMSEPGREGDEESGDEHSSGHQAGDQQELQYDTEDPEDADSGAPGEMTEKLAHLDPTRKSLGK